MNNHLEAEEEGLEKTLANDPWFNYSQHIDIVLLKNSLISLKVFYHNQKVYLDYCTERVFSHVLSKKNLFESKNCKQLARKGIPVKHMREFLMKLFSVELNEEYYAKQLQSVFKSFDPKELGDVLPTLSQFNSFSETIRVHCLNERGVIAVKQVMWILDSMFSQIGYSPMIIRVVSVLLLFCSELETYHIIRSLIEMDLDNKDLFRLRWHFRFSLNENNKIVASVIESLNQISKNTSKIVFSHFEKINFPANRLIEDMIFGFFLDYLNFEGFIRLLPLFLVEGVKVLYRLTYALLKMLRERIIQITSPDDVIKLVRQYGKEITDTEKIFGLAFSYGLTRNNNKYDYKVNLNDTVSKKTVFYLPNLNTSSSILKQSEIAYLWTILPDKLTQKDAKLIFNSEIQGNSLQTIYSLNEVYKNDSYILFIIETTNSDVFGGVLSNLFKINDKYEKPITTYMYYIRPHFQVFENNTNSPEVLFCSEERICLGNGPKGPAITVNEDLFLGESYDGNCFGFTLWNRDQKFEIVRMEIFNLL